MRKFRYIRDGINFNPESSLDNQTWESWDLALIEKIRILGEIVKSLNGVFYSDTKTLYFRNEIECSAFIGACKIYYREEIVEFE